MEQIKKNQDVMKEEIYVVRGTIDQILKAILAMAKREDNPQGIVSAGNTTSLFGSIHSRDLR